MKEIEYKWQAASLRDYQMFLQLAEKHGAKLSHSKKVKIKDLYLDTPENIFQSLHIASRLRFSHGQFEFTLKSFPDSTKKIFIRNEKTIRLPPLDSKKEALKYCQNKFFKNIQPLFEILNNRKSHTLTLPCGTCAEACFDQVIMLSHEKKFRMLEIELEFKRGDLKNFKAFIRKLSPLPLIPSPSSKFKTAMSQFAGNSPSIPLETLKCISLQILRFNIEKLRQNETDAESFFPEAIHDMRVAIRRLRAALKTFKKILPSKTERIQNGLIKLGCILGKKRDLDVLSEFILSTFSIKSLFLQKLVKRSDRSKEQIQLMLKSKYYENLIDSLEHLKTVKTDKNILKFARNRIQKELDKVLKIAFSIDSKKADDKILHKLRISIKKLRYVCEFFQPIFTKYICSLDAFIDKTKGIQDILGNHQDAIAGISMLMRYKHKLPADEFLQIQKKFLSKKRKAFKVFLNLWKDYWVGIGFRHPAPINAIELILD